MRIKNEDRMTKKQAIEIFGSGRKVAKALDITKESVSEWGIYVPELRQYQIEKILREREDLTNVV